jgi:hypothetical protein
MFFSRFRTENCRFFCIFPTFFFPTASRNVKIITELPSISGIMTPSDGIMTPYNGFTVIRRIYTPSNGYKDTVFCADSGTSRCTLFAYILDAVGKKTWQNRRKTGIFHCENERKTFTFFNRTLRLG